MSDILSWCIDETCLVPFGNNQTQFVLFHEVDTGDIARDENEMNELSAIDPEDTDLNLLLPSGYNFWARVWWEAERIVRAEGDSIPPPANPREIVDILNDDACPNCEMDKNAGFMHCRQCASAEW